MKKIVIIVSRRPRRQDIENIILSGIEKCNEKFPEKIETLKISSLIPEPAILKRIFCEYDLVIGDVSGTAHETIYQVGLAQGCNTPVLLTSDENGRPVLWEFNTQYCNLYPKTGNVESFINRLSSEIKKALLNPQDYYLKEKNEHEGDIKTNLVFVSYSRADKETLDRLRIHLAPLNRKRLIKYWDDKKIVAGQHWRAEIQKSLEKAAIAILLVSADFLASAFVIEQELPVLLKAAVDKGTTILPVVLKPCGFFRDPQLKKYQSVTDPLKPLLSLTNIEQEGIFEKIAEQIANELQNKN